MAQRLLTPESLNIHAIEYEESTSRLTVEFKSVSTAGRPIYDFDGVSKEAWGKFASAESKGKHFNAEIKPRYKGVKR